MSNYTPNNSNPQNNISYPNPNQELEIKNLKDQLLLYGENIKKLDLIIKKNNSKFLEESNNLKEQLNKKEEEIKNYQEKIKSLERKNEEIYKNVTSGNLSDLNEIKRQFEKEKIILTELNKTYKQGLDEKTEIIVRLQEENQNLRNENEDERKKSENLTNIVNSKYDQKSMEIEFHKTSTQNSKLKTKLISAEEKIEKLNEIIENLKSEKTENEKLYKDNLEILRNQFNFKSSSYTTLLSDYSNINSILSHTQDDLEKAKFFNLKYEKENLILEKKNRELENQVINLKAEVTGLQTRIKGNELEMESNRKKVKEYENKLNEYKLSKQVFEVTYIYLRMPLEGRITFQKEGENYVVMIHNRTATRKYSFLELDISRDANENNKIIIKFMKENSQEEYFCNDLNRLIEYYEEYKKKAIESTDFSTVKKTDKTKSEIKRTNVQKQLQNMFDM